MSRRNSLGMSDAEIEANMQILVNAFTTDWLNQNTGHPIQTLWQRKDELATNELYSLASAIQELSPIDAKWVQEQVKKAKSQDRKNSQGAIFEILALNILHAPEHPVIPAKLNQAGFDGILTKPGGHDIRVSIKNYGTSAFQQKFDQKAKAIEKVMVKLLAKFNYPPVQIALDFPTEYPEDRDWKMLEDRIRNIFKDKRHAADPFAALAEPLDASKERGPENARVIFTIFISPFLHDLEKFHSRYNSYTLMISAPYHKNEKANLFSKIEDACANLSKHSATETDHIINSLFLHLPETISLAEAVTWLDEYFTLFPNKPITFIILYQPTVSTNITDNSSTINHAIKYYMKDEAKLKGDYQFSVPVGSVSDESSGFILSADYPDGKRETIKVENKYLYQQWGTLHEDAA